MTREEAIAILQEKYDYCKSFYDLAAHPEEDYPEMAKYLQALQFALSALRPVSREQLSEFKTCELVDELKKREGVETHIAEPYQDVTVSVNGPAMVLVVID